VIEKNATQRRWAYRLSIGYGANRARNIRRRSILQNVTRYAMVYGGQKSILVSVHTEHHDTDRREIAANFQQQLAGRRIGSKRITQHHIWTSNNEL
jgi:hypothetical protein